MQSGIWLLKRPGNYETTSSNKMSSRALKRLERARIEDSDSQSKKGNNPDEDSFEEELVVRKTFNAFSFLDNNSEDERAEEEKEVNNKDAVRAVENIDTQKQESEGNPKHSQKKKQKKNKGKKNKKAEDSDEELEKYLEEVRKRDLVSALEAPDISNSKNAILEEVQDYEEDYNLVSEPVVDYDSNFKFFTTERLKQSLPLLSIKSCRDLDPDEEFKNFLGDLSVETLEDANSTTSLSISPQVLDQFKKLAKLTRGWGGKDRRCVPGTSRKLLLVRIRDDFPPTTKKPLNMEELSKNERLKYLDYKEDTVQREDLETKISKEVQLGVKYFTFSKVLNVQEKVACTKFYASVVLTPDPDSLMQLVQSYPYQAETLLQVAMILLRQGSDKATSNALVERCLFVFDRVFHKDFHEILSNGKCGLLRLPFESFMNRQFYLCLFRYIISLGERSTFFTAFSYCKFLLGINPAEDPMGVRYFIDFYAIMSENFDYLIKFVNSPLVTTYEKWLTPGLAFSSVLACLYKNDEEGATESLRRAYKAHPYLSLKLIEKFGELSSMDLKEKELLYTSEQSIIAETYLVRVNLLWNKTKHIEFLVDNLVSLFKVDPPAKRSESKLKSSIYNLLGYNENVINSELPYNLIRFVILSGENKIMAKLPEEIWKREDILEYDVLPPSSVVANYDEHTGFGEKQSVIVDRLINYVDQNLLGNIIQSRTALDEDFVIPEQ